MGMVLWIEAPGGLISYSPFFSLEIMPASSPSISPVPLLFLEDDHYRSLATIVLLGAPSLDTLSDTLSPIIQSALEVRNDELYLALIIIF